MLGMPPRVPGLQRPVLLKLTTRWYLEQSLRDAAHLARYVHALPGGELPRSVNILIDPLALATWEKSVNNHSCHRGGAWMAQ
jgi:hypothetical protein